MDKQSKQSTRPIDVEALSKIYIYLSGVCHGKGNILPLGTMDLEELMNAILYLRGDSRFTASERDK